MLLEDKIAVIYGGGGAVGAAVARTFAAEGARVFLAGRTLAKLEAVAEEISPAGGPADIAEVDALDEQAVDAHVRDIVARAGESTSCSTRSACTTSRAHRCSTCPWPISPCPSTSRLRTQFLTARAVARQMVEQRSGVIMTITAEPTPAPNIGGFLPACAVVEALWRGFATELGPHGIRTVVLRSAGSPDSPAVQEVFKLHTGAAGDSTEAIQAQWGGGTLLNRLPLLADVANAAALLASDRAGAITATLANVTCGAYVDV